MLYLALSMGVVRTELPWRASPDGLPYPRRYRSSSLKNATDCSRAHRECAPLWRLIAGRSFPLGHASCIQAYRSCHFVVNGLHSGFSQFAVGLPVLGRLVPGRKCLRCGSRRLCRRDRSTFFCRRAAPADQGPSERNEGRHNSFRTSGRSRGLVESGKRFTCSQKQSRLASVRLDAVAREPGSRALVWRHWFATLSLQIRLFFEIYRRSACLLGMRNQVVRTSKK